MLVFTHSPSPPVENEEKEDAEKGKVEEEEPAEGNLGKVDEEEVKAEDLERRASIHFVSRPVRLRPGEKLIAEVSSSSTPAVLSSPMPGDPQSSQVPKQCNEPDVGGWGKIDLPHQVRGGGPEGWTLFLSFKVNQRVYIHSCI